MLKTLKEGTTQQRTQVLQKVCPCRNDVQDRAVWARVFQTAHEPGKERVRVISRDRDAPQRGEDEHEMARGAEGLRG